MTVLTLCPKGIKPITRDEQPRLMVYNHSLFEIFIGLRSTVRLVLTDIG